MWRLEADEWFSHRLVKFELQSVDFDNALPLLLVLRNLRTFFSFELHLDHTKRFVFFERRLHYPHGNWIFGDGRILGPQILD